MVPVNVNIRLLSGVIIIRQFTLFRRVKMNCIESGGLWPTSNHHFTDLRQGIQFVGETSVPEIPQVAIEH